MNYKIKRDSYNIMLLEDCKINNNYGIPSVNATQVIPSKLVAFNECLNIRNQPDYFVHFYIADYQFERIGNAPGRYLDVLRRCAGVIAPDFSMYLDMPRAMQIYNHYRNQALASYFQRQGIVVIPNISWSDSDSFSWCFAGQPQNSVVAVSTNGCMNGYSLLHFVDGYLEMQKRLKPSKVIIYGQVPDDLQDEKNIIQFTSKLQRLKEIQKEK